MKLRGAIERQQEQRYWRSRANRQVRKARRLRVGLRWGFVLLANAGIAAALFYCGTKIFERLAERPEFALRRIEIESTHRASTERIRGRLAPLLGHSLLALDLRQAERLVRQDPWVRGAVVRRRMPGTLRVLIEERVPRALAVIGGVVHVVDGSGYVVGPSGPDRADDLPVLTGLGGVEGRDLAAALRRGVGLLERLRRTDPAFLPWISELDLSRGDRVEIRTLNPGPTLLLDPQHVERNVEEYLGLMSDIERRVGKTTYVDLRWRDRIFVMPAKTQPVERGG